MHTKEMWKLIHTTYTIYYTFEHAYINTIMDVRVLTINCIYSLFPVLHFTLNITKPTICFVTCYSDLFLRPV